MVDRILVIGMMGAGKSTVARLAARRLGWTWLDTDTEVTRAAGASVADIFTGQGEPAFRRHESRAIDEVLRHDGPLVVSVGGGAVLDEANRATLASAGTVVWLRARPETLVGRVRDGAGRPLLAGDGPEERADTLRALDTARRPLYADLADVVIDVDRLSAPAAADHLIDAVGLAPPATSSTPDSSTPDRGVHP